MDIPASRFLFQDAHDVGLLHDQQILTTHPYLGARPLTEEHTVAGLHVEGLDLAALVTRTRPNGNDLALLRLFLGGSGMMMPPAVRSSGSMRRTTTRSCKGRNSIETPSCLTGLDWVAKLGTLNT
jgi:hypothetical protein